MPDAEVAETERSLRVGGTRSAPKWAMWCCGPCLGPPARGAVGRVRLSYRRAAEVFRTASGGWTLHQLRHSRLTHLAEAGVPGPLLMVKSRHGRVKTLNLYAKRTFEAVAEVTARLDPVRRRGAPRGSGA